MCQIAEELEINLIEVTQIVASLGLLKLTQILRLEHPDIEFEFIKTDHTFNSF